MINNLKPGKDCIGVGVFALVQNTKGEILLARCVKSEKKDEIYEKVWSMVGGTVEYKEKIEDALLREIEEETGLKVKIEKFLGYNELINDKKHWVALNFLVSTDSNVFINIEPEKQADLQWFDINEIPEDISEYTKESLERLKKA